ncbi:hypothetical protein [Thiothrix subterranea]|nr:hypothetical protein [Thiothrix subterranea]
MIVDNLFANNNIIGEKVKFLFTIVDKTAGAVVVDEEMTVKR